MEWQSSWKDRATVLVVVVCCVLLVTTAGAQSTKTAKQAASLEKSGEGAKAAVQGVIDGLRGLLLGYNSIISGEAKDSQAAYKKLVKDLKGTENGIDDAKKQVGSLKKEADKFFKAWQEDLAAISSESLREKSAKRMEATKKKYASLGETLAQAGQLFAPVVQSLNDQILFLGRDLSPEAVADLKDEATKLNQQAEEATAKVKELLQTAGKIEADAELKPDGEK